MSNVISIGRSAEQGKIRLSKAQIGKHLGRSPRWLEGAMKAGMPSELVDGKRQFELGETVAWVEEHYPGLLGKTQATRRQSAAEQPETKSQGETTDPADAPTPAAWRPVDQKPSRTSPEGIPGGAAAKFLGAKARTLESWSERFGFPVVDRFEGRRPRYRLAELEALKAAFSHTSEISVAIESARRNVEGPEPPAPDPQEERIAALEEKIGRLEAQVAEVQGSEPPPSAA